MEKMSRLVFSLGLILGLLGSAQAQDLTPPPLEVQRLQALPPMNVPAKITRLPASTPKTPFTFYSGSLKENIQRIAKECGWGTVVWKTPYDYRWMGTTHFVDNYLPDILNKVLNGYPLQAVFYQGNHILVIIPRNLS